MGDNRKMKNTYLCILFLFLMNMACAQNKAECSGYVSDDVYLRYTASGYQDVVNGNHSKAMNESRKIANIVAESELAKMVKSAVTQFAEVMSVKSDYYSEIVSDTTLVSSYMMFKGMKTICQSETKLIGNTYVTYITKEISYDNISDMMSFKNEKDRQEFIKLIAE